MTQDPSQTPEPNQPSEASTHAAADAPAEASTTDIALTDEALTSALLGDVPPEESQLQSSDSPAEESAASIEVATPEVSATEALIPESSTAETSAIKDQPVTPLQSPAAQSVPPPTPESAPAAKSSPAKSSPATETPAVSSSNRIAAFIRLVGQLWGIVLPIALIGARWLWQVSLITLKWIREAWKVILPRIRTLLPEGWRKLPDWALTTVAITMLVFVVWLTAQLWPSPAPVVASDRTPPALNAPAPEQPAEPVPDPAEIARIQTQVAEVTDQYAEGLIQTVQANFKGNLLTVKVGEPWFNLDAGSQAQLANELLKRSRKLDFSTLELIDTEGELLARSPVVGAKMVVYERLKPES